MAKAVGFNGELIHFGSARFRVTGSGSLHLSLTGLDGVSSYVMPSLTMQSAPGREPSVLANFISQRAYLELSTTNINETFIVAKIVVFVRPIASDYPQ